MLTKIRVENNIPNTKIHPLLELIITKDFTPNSIYFTNGSNIINNKWNYSYKFNGKEIIKLSNILHLPIYFYKNIMVWKSIECFTQNNIYNASQIRKYVVEILKDSSSKNITGIGGESYCYFYCLHKYNSYLFLTNNMYIEEDYHFNSNKYLEDRINYCEVIDYNKKIDYYRCGDIIINLAKLTYKVIDFLNNNNFTNIIIINCHSVNRKRLELLKYKMSDFGHFNNVTVYIYKLDFTN